MHLKPLFKPLIHPLARAKKSQQIKLIENKDTVPSWKISLFSAPPARSPSRDPASGTLSNQSQRSPALSVGLYLSRGMIPEYLPCSLASPDSCDWREANSVGSQPLELRALSFLSCGLSPQITKTLYSSDSTVKQRVSCWKLCFT